MCILLFSPIHERDEKLVLLNSLDCTFKFFPIHKTVWKLGFLKSPFLQGMDSQIVKIVFHYDM